jgi:hypothetical protein
VTALVERQAPGHDTAHLSPAQERVLALDGHVVRLVGDELEPGTVGIDVPGKRIDVLERRPLPVLLEWLVDQLQEPKLRPCELDRS